jgi:flagellar biosynthesis/type III secretory pathway protein FliH
MKFDATRRVSLTKEFFMRLAETSIDREDQLLVTGFFSAYQCLSPPEVLQLEEEVSKIMPEMAREKAIQLTNPFIELGILRGREEGRQEGRQEGREEGRQQGEIELVLRQLRHSLGTLTAPQEKSVRMLKLPQIEALGEALLKFTSNSDLDRWLRTRTTPRNR